MVEGAVKRAKQGGSPISGMPSAPSTASTTVWINTSPACHGASRQSLSPSSATLVVAQGALCNAHFRPATTTHRPSAPHTPSLTARPPRPAQA